MTSRPIRLLFAAGLSAALVASCSSASSLPTLSGFAAVRDQAARTEAAAQERASLLAASATECASCREALGAVAADSAARVEALGGLWDPWAGQQTSDDVPSPAPLAQAPTDVSAFISWLVRTAQRDLALASSPQRTDAQQARLLAASALGRYSSALSLASAYGVSVDAGFEQAGLVNERVNILSRSGAQTWNIEDFSAVPVSSSLSLSADVSLDSDEVSAALTQWDCVASSLPSAQVNGGVLSDAYALSGQLLSRVDTVVRAGARDERVQRCFLQDASSRDFALRLLGADTALFESSSPQVRTLGASAALTDIDQWSSRTSLPALIGVQ